MEAKIRAFQAKFNAIKTSPPFVYFFTISDDAGNVYRYVGRARRDTRLDDYRRNIDRIWKKNESREYRAIHFALWIALENNWDIQIRVLETCRTKVEANRLKKHSIRELKPNLNYSINRQARRWTIDE